MSAGRADLERRPPVGNKPAGSRRSRGAPALDRTPKALTSAKAPARTPERPFFGLRNKTCTYRVILDIGNHRLQMGFITHVAIEVIPFPEPPRSLEEKVRFPGRESLPTLNDLGQRIIPLRLDQHMDMVRHDDPSQEAVTRAVEVQ